MMKNAFYFMLKALFYSYVEKRLDKKAKVHFKIYDQFLKK